MRQGRLCSPPPLSHASQQAAPDALTSTLGLEPPSHDSTMESKAAHLASSSGSRPDVLGSSPSPSSLYACRKQGTRRGKVWAAEARTQEWLLAPARCQPSLLPLKAGAALGAAATPQPLPTAGPTPPNRRSPPSCCPSVAAAQSNTRKRRKLNLTPATAAAQSNTLNCHHHALTSGPTSSNTSSLSSS